MQRAAAAAGTAAARATAKRKYPRPPPDVVARLRAERKAAKRARRTGKGGAGGGADGPVPISKKARNAQRYKLRVAYNGRAYHGWQKQGRGGGGGCDNAGGVSSAPLPTIEGTMEAALRGVLGQKVRLCPSGRTDSRVSARGQVVQYDANLNRTLYTRITGQPPPPPPPPPASSSSSGNSSSSSSGNSNDNNPNNKPPIPVDPGVLLSKFNAALPEAIRVLAVEPVPSSFNVMSPRWKRYEYRFPTGARDTGDEWCRTVLQHASATRNAGDDGHSNNDSSAEVEVSAADTAADSRPLQLPPDVRAMHAAAQVLVGTHDFAAFQSAGGRPTTVRTVHACSVTVAPGSGDAVLRIVGNGFLMHMVRIVAGTLLEVGCGLRTAEGVADALASRARRRAGSRLPGQHLTLDHVEYDLGFEAYSSRL